MINRFLVILIFMVFVISTTGQTQDEPTCPALVNSVVEVAAAVCGETGRNEACYGNVLVTAQPFPNVTDFNFVQEGDRVSVADIEHLQLSPMNVETDEWGVAVLRIQANLPDTAPGQNVTMVVFGDVELENAGGAAQSDSALPAYAPMQAFYFRSGIGDSACAAAPDSGILIQTPGGVGQVELLVNEVRIRLGSTAVLQAERGESLVVRTLEGEAEVEADGVVQTVAVGEEATVPMNDDLRPAGPPSQPATIQYESVQALPTTLLPETVNVVQAVTAGTGMIIVDGNAGWVDTGIIIESGQVVTITANGTINMWDNCETEKIDIAPDFDCNSLILGPDGGLPADVNPDPGRDMRLAPNLTPHALIGRIGAGEAFFVGQNLTFTATTSGTLQLGVNDSDANNVGAFGVDVMIADAEPTQGQVAPAPTDAPAAETHIVTVDSSSDWVDSGVQVEAGQVYTLVASGIVNVWTDCATDRFTEFGDEGAAIDCNRYINGPAGGVHVHVDGTPMGTPATAGATGGYPMLDAPFWSLLGRIGGGGAMFVVGTGGTFTADASGTLQFRINDDISIRDNSGTFTVSILIGEG